MNAEDMHQETKLFDENGRCIPKNINSPVNIETRRYFIFESRSITIWGDLTTQPMLYASEPSK